jgi:hypothetical protein
MALRDLRRVGEPGDPRLDDPDAGRRDPRADLRRELAGDLLGVVAQGQLALGVRVVRVAVRDVPDRGLGLDGDELDEVVDLEHRLPRCPPPARRRRRRSRSGCRRRR